MPKTIIAQDHDGDGLTFDGQHYTCAVAPIHDLVIGVNDAVGVRISFGWEPSIICNDCPHGHPHEVTGAERVAVGTAAQAVAQAVDNGWLTRD